MGEDAGKRLRKQLATMTTRDWLVRVAELRNEVEYRDRVVEQQRETIASQLEIIERLEAQVVSLGHEPVPRSPRKKRPSKRGPATGSGGKLSS